MRILLTAQSSTGHLLPLLGLARAARAAGHEVGVLTHPDTAAIAEGLAVVPAGITIAEGLAEVERRGFPSPREPGPGAVEMFAGVTVDLSYDAALAGVTAFAPDLIVCDPFHVLGQIVASRLGVPWAAHGISGGLPPELSAALAQRAARQYAERSIVARPRIAYVDPYPELLHLAEEEWEPDPDRIAVRPATHTAGEPPLARTGDRPTVLVTFGTTVRDPEALTAAIASTVDAGFDVIATERADALTRSLDSERVRAVGFAPLAALLPAVDAVVTAGGTGTMLSALVAGLPLVIRPVIADQPFNARRISALGLGTAIEEFDAAGPAVAAALDDEALLGRLRDAAAAIAAIEPPEVVLERLLGRLPSRDPAAAA